MLLNADGAWTSLCRHHDIRCVSIYHENAQNWVRLKKNPPNGSTSLLQKLIYHKFLVLYEVIFQSIFCIYSWLLRTHPSVHRNRSKLEQVILKLGSPVLLTITSQIILHTRPLLSMRGLSFQHCVHNTSTLPSISTTGSECSCCSGNICAKF